jgi:hypothetical protein
MSAVQAGEGVRISVLLAGEHPCLFSPIVFLEKMGCECHFAESPTLRNRYDVGFLAGFLHKALDWILFGVMI